ncbi:MAG: chemotaxis protein CheW [Planctomycetota bacterium]|nr:chemotaxis protein CheW [Planctomycetota bacterium]
MQAVVFQVGAERFAIDTTSITEVIPGITARPVPSAPAALNGVIEYRGAVVPVLDLCRLFDRGDCPVRLSNRILICNLGDGGERWGEGAVDRALLGILAENVTRVVTLDPDAPGSHPGPATEGFGGLGRILRDPDGLLQLVEVRELIPPAVLAAVVRDAGSTSP